MVPKTKYDNGSCSPRCEAFQLCGEKALSQFEEDFKDKMHDHASEIDPASEMDWWALTVGFLIGRGVVDYDKLIASHIRYHTDLG